jgi:hypothetical protein
MGRGISWANCISPHQRIKLTHGIGVAHRQLFVNITPNNLEHLSSVHFFAVNAP